MISLICTHCQTTLSIDDAFAGGVCRCQHCGTIQTVPMKQASAVAGENGDLSAGRSLYRTQAREQQAVPPGDSTNATLEQLADVVASSGLGGSGLGGSGLAGSGLSTLRNRKSTAAPATSPSDAIDKPNRTPLMIAVGAALALLIGVGVWLGMRKGDVPVQSGSDLTNTGSAPGEGSNVGATPTPAVAGPQFCGVRLTGASIIYLLDRGDSAREIFDSLKQATFASISSLSNERKFQVICWDNHTADVSYPPSEPTFATADNLTACIKAFDDVTAFHQSDVLAPLKKAVGESPDEIVIVTAKGFDLDESFAAAVEAVVKDTKIKLDTISLRGNECPALKAIAHVTGGSYAVVSDGGLRAAAPAQ